MLAYALRYRNAGLCPIPIWPDRRKNPKVKGMGQFTERLPEIAEIRRWWDMWPNANIGLITGYWQNLIALDFDSLASYNAWDGQMQTWTVSTARGYHVWFQLTDIPGKSEMWADGHGHEVLVRAKGGYCIVPPSNHHSGSKYTTVANVPPLYIDRLDDALPGWKPKQVSKPQRPTKSPVLTPGSLRIENMVSPLGKPNQRGAYQAFCPFHEDKNPSAWVNPSQGRFGCNACYPGQWWDAINVYAMLREVEKANHLINERAGNRRQ